VISGLRALSPELTWGSSKLVARSSKLISVDPAEQLQRMYLAGFELQSFDRFPKCVGVVRDGCIALLVPGVDGLQILGTPGWRMGEAIGVLVEKNGRQVFQNKQEIVEATPEKMKQLHQFTEDLHSLLAGRA
jgi:hypothetical protein